MVSLHDVNIVFGRSPDNVAYGLEVASVPKAERLDRARAQLELVGLADWADKRVDELSGGMQQRVWLARAFAAEAPILLMDEPFSALDPLIRNKLQDELLELQERLGRTIRFVSHHLEEALKIGNHIAIMEGSRIVQCATPREIVLNPATDYVAEFVVHINPLNMLTAAEVLQPFGGSLSSDTKMIASNTPVREIIELFATGASALAVREGGETSGIVTSKSVFEALK